MIGIGGEQCGVCAVVGQFAFFAADTQGYAVGRRQRGFDGGAAAFGNGGEREVFIDEDVGDFAAVCKQADGLIF